MIAYILIAIVLLVWNISLEIKLSRQRKETRDVILEIIEADKLVCDVVKGLVEKVDE